MKTLGPIRWDFTKLEMLFNVKGKELVLTGVDPQKLKVVEGEASEKILKDASHLCLLQLHELPEKDMIKDVLQEPGMESVSLHSVELPQIRDLKQKYCKIFEEPKSLPPHKGCLITPFHYIQVRDL